MTDEETKTLAFGYAEKLKPVIKNLKETRNKLVVKIQDRLSAVIDEPAGYTLDFDANQLEELIRQLREAQHALIEKVAEHNRHADRAESTRILTRTVIIVKKP